MNTNSPTLTDMVRDARNALEDGNTAEAHGILFGDMMNVALDAHASQSARIAELEGALAGMLHLYEHEYFCANGGKIVANARALLANKGDR